MKIKYLLQWFLREGCLKFDEDANGNEFSYTDFKFTVHVKEFNSFEDAEHFYNNMEKSLADGYDPESPIDIMFAMIGKTKDNEICRILKNQASEMRRCGL